MHALSENKCIATVLQAALQLTEAQQVDLIHLRRLFYGRVGALARERRQLLLKLPVSGASESAPEASSRLADVRTVAQQLQDNSCTEFRMYLQLTSAYRRGVSKQKFSLCSHCWLAS